MSLSSLLVTVVPFDGLQEKRDADRSKRKRVELEESLRQQKEMVAQMRRAVANTSEQESQSVAPSSSFQMRGENEALELRIAQPSGSERKIQVGEGRRLGEPANAFQILEEQAGTGSAHAPAMLPSRKRSKVGA